MLAASVSPAKVAAARAIRDFETILMDMFSVERRDNAECRNLSSSA